MADEFQTSGNWWDSSRPASRYEAAAAGTASPPSSALNGLGIGGFGWSNSSAENNNNTNLMVDMKSRASMDSASVSGNSPMAFHEGGKLQHSDNSAAGDANLHLMGLGLSNSPTLDWNHALFRGEKAAPEGSFRAILQDGMAGPNPGFQQEQIQWQREKLFHGHNDHHHSNTTTTTNSRGFSLDQSSQFSPQYSSGDSTVTCQGLTGQHGFQGGAGGDSAALYGSPSAILQGLFGPDGTAAASFGLNSSDLLGNSSNWASGNSNASSTNPNKLPQFLRSTNSPPKPSPAFGGANNSHLQFSNNAAFWNAPEAAAMKDARAAAAAGFFPALQPQFPTANFEEKPKNISEVRDSGSVAKKSGNEAASNKRPRNDQTTSTLPAFKVRKEKMGDRITALQQLVSPFGKTDTASVLSEAIEYIKFLHEQVTVLSTPYMKSGAAIQHHQINSEKSKDSEDPKQDLRSRGLCLVPVSSTFPVTHETTVDFWTPTFGGTFR